MRYILCLFLALNGFRCGVEAGNAGGGKGLVGNVKILFAQEQNTGSESLSVQLGTLGLLADDDSEGATLTPTLATVDLYGSESSDNVLVAESSLVPAGKYAKIAIRLTGDKPVRYRDSSGNDHDVGLDDNSQQSFYITQAISIAADETTIIVINLDPYKSLHAPLADDKFVFKPRGDAVQHEQELRYRSTTSVADALCVCAYGYFLQTPPFPPQLQLREGPGRDPPPPLSPGTQIEGRPRFGTRPDLIKDTDSSCNNAFAKSPVKDGKFEFRHLLPGTYSLRIFTSSGSFTDITPDVSLPEGSRD